VQDYLELDKIEHEMWFATYQINAPEGAGHMWHFTISAYLDFLIGGSFNFLFDKSGLMLSP